MLVLFVLHVKRSNWNKLITIITWTADSKYVYCVNYWQIVYNIPLLFAEAVSRRCSVRKIPVPESLFLIKLQALRLYLGFFLFCICLRNKGWKSHTNRLQKNTQGTTQNAFIVLFLCMVFYDSWQDQLNFCCFFSLFYLFHHTTASPWSLFDFKMCLPTSRSLII